MDRRQDIDDAPIRYMERTRDYYAAIGYATAYRWASFADVPFQPLPKPLAQCRVALVTTAARFDPAKGDQGPFMMAPRPWITLSAFPTWPMTARTPPRPIPIAGFRCR